MSQPNEELLRGIHTDLSHAKASTHAPKLQLNRDNGRYRLGIHITDHAEEYLHHTSWLKIFVDDTPAGEIDLEPPFQTGRFEIDLTEIDPGSTVRVQAKCNLHGIWENSVTADSSLRSRDAPVAGGPEKRTLGRFSWTRPPVLPLPLLRSRSGEKGVAPGIVRFWPGDAGPGGRTSTGGPPPDEKPVKGESGGDPVHPFTSLSEK